MQFRRFVFGLSPVVALGLFVVLRDVAQGQAVGESALSAPVLKPRKRVLLGQAPGAGAIELSPDGRRLLALGVGDEGHKSVRLWNVSTRASHDLFFDTDYFLWTHDSRLIAYEFDEPIAWLLSPQHPNRLRRFGKSGFALADDETQDVKVSPDRSQLWLLTAHQFLRFSIGNGSVLQRLRWGDKHTKRSTASSTEASLSPNGSEILSQEKFITFYSTRNGGRLRQLPFLKNSAHTALFNRTGNVDEVLADAPPGSSTEDVDNDRPSTVVTRRASDGLVLSQRQDVNGGYHGGPEIQENDGFVYTLEENDQIWKRAK